MGLDSFANDSWRDTGVINTVEGAVEAMKEMESHLGKSPTAKEWNDNREDLGITTSAMSLKRQVGLRFNEVKKRAGCEVISHYRQEEYDPDDIREDLDDFDGYDAEADGYVYYLDVAIESVSEDYYYVGSTVNSEGLWRRIASHSRVGGDFTSVEDTKWGTALVDRESTDADISVIKVESIYQIPDEPDDVFGRRVRNIERERRLSLAIDKSTTKVLGQGI